MLLWLKPEEKLDKSKQDTVGVGKNIDEKMQKKLNQNSTGGVCEEEER